MFESSSLSFKSLWSRAARVVCSACTYLSTRCMTLSYFSPSSFAFFSAAIDEARPVRRSSSRSSSVLCKETFSSTTLCISLVRVCNRVAFCIPCCLRAYAISRIRVSRRIVIASSKPRRALKNASPPSRTSWSLFWSGLESRQRSCCHKRRACQRLLYGSFVYFDVWYTQKQGYIVCYRPLLY